jgi:4-hydroxy-3-polyprenylbenzoate decarboxylase
LRDSCGRKVKLVKCITNDLYIPYDADIVIEGYIDPAEPPVTEGPFGDHTGFYSLTDLYPVFHVTCITHLKKAVYPATIVGIPPQEDAWLTKATEKIFLSPVRIAIQPEVIDFHMPEAGVAHNLVIVNISKNYPGQGMKVISSLSGAGQMMLTKYLVVVSGSVNIRNYRELMIHILANTDFGTDIVFTHGPLDVLDHSSDSFSLGGKAGIDATIKLPEEVPAGQKPDSTTLQFWKT